MESRILLLGPMGAGKTTALRTVSDIHDPEVRASDEVANLDPTTTMPMDRGIMRLEGDDRLLLYSAAGQDRFHFMWDDLLEQADAVLLVLNHSAADPVRDFHRYHAPLLRATDGRRPLAVGVTHTDLAPLRSMDIYEDYLRPVKSRCGCMVCTPSIHAMDARNRADVRAVLATLAMMLEVGQRFTVKPCLA
jgi:signal recognition particle receptor subunit beta